MADTPTTGNNGFGIVIGLIAVTVVAGLGYWLYTKKGGTGTGELEVPVGDNPASNTEKNPVVKEGADTKAHTVDSATNAAKPDAEKKVLANTPATGSGMSALRANHDAVWNYQKRNGVWYTAKKDGSVQWVSLAKNKKATDTLNAAYPND